MSMHSHHFFCQLYTRLFCREAHALLFLRQQDMDDNDLKQQDLDDNDLKC